MPRHDDKSLGEAMADSIALSHVREIVTDIAEIALDSTTSSEFVEAIPFASTFVHLVKGGLALRDQLFLEKVARFLYKIETIPEKKRVEYVNDLGKDKRKYGEAIILLLERLDKLEKADIVASIHHRQILEEIKIETAEILCSIVDRVHLPYLKIAMNKKGEIREIGGGFYHIRFGRLPVELMNHFISVGLFEQMLNYDKRKILGLSVPRVNLEYEPSRYCGLLFSILQKDNLCE